MAGRGPVLFSDLRPVKYTDVHRHGRGPLCPEGANRKAARAEGKARSKGGDESPAQDQRDEARCREVTCAPLHMSDLELLEFVLCLRPLLELGAELEADIDAQTRNWGGRKREYTATGILAFEIATWVFPSYTATEDNLADEKNWDRLWSAVAHAHADRPELWLPPASTSRDQHYRFRKQFLKGRRLEKMKKQINTAAAEAGVDIGVLIPERTDSMTKPELFIGGDGTYVRSSFKTHFLQAVDPITGMTRRTDPEAGTYRGKKREGYGGPG